MNRYFIIDGLNNDIFELNNIINLYKYMRFDHKSKITSKTNTRALYKEAIKIIINNIKEYDYINNKKELIEELIDYLKEIKKEL